MSKKNHQKQSRTKPFLLGAVVSAVILGIGSYFSIDLRNRELAESRAQVRVLERDLDRIRNPPSLLYDSSERVIENSEGYETRGCVLRLANEKDGVRLSRSRSLELLGEYISNKEGYSPPTVLDFDFIHRDTLFTEDEICSILEIPYGNVGVISLTKNKGKVQERI